MEQYILSILQDAGIEVDLKTLQNPTEEFMIDLVMEYLKRFHFDSEKIAKPTPEQLDCLSCDESAADAIKAINLYAALSTICEGIFLKDLTLTDLTSPSGCKKTCKRIQVLFNFLIYVRNKKMEKEPLLLELENRCQEIQDFIDQKAELAAKTGALIHEREAKLEKKKQLKKAIEEMKLLLEEDNKISISLKKHADEVTAKQQAALDKYNTLKGKTQELFKSKKDLQSKIVESPEEYMKRSKELKKILEEKLEERQILNDSINQKKKQIKNNETADAMIKECNNNESIKVGEIMQKLKETITQISSTKSQIDKLRNEIDFLDSKSRESRGDSDVSETIELQNSQKNLSELLNSLGQKQREHDSLKAKLDTLRSKQQQLKHEVENEIKKIAVAESEYDDQLEHFKVLYQNEIQKEKTLREEVSQFL